MQARVYAVSISHTQPHPYITFYRTDGTPDGGSCHFRPLTTPRLCRLMRALVSTASKVELDTFTKGEWTSWSVRGLVTRLRIALQQHLEGMTIGL